MLSPKFYSQISVCQACHGWGTAEVPSLSSKSVCTECAGEGIAIFQSQKTYSWGAKTFVNFRERSMLVYKKIFLILIFFILIALIISGIKSLIGSLP